MNTSKFAYYQEGVGEAPYHHPHHWQLEPAGSGERLVIGPREGFVEVMLDLAACLQAPYAVMYLLSVPRGGSEPGRYQLDGKLNLDELKSFLTVYRLYLEGDARHDLWIHSPDSSATVIYEEHNLIYAYGPLDCYLQALSNRGLTAGTVELPYPHFHKYFDDFDESERQIVQNHAWRRTPLVPGVDD